jgi:D-psicose/D-tagatose/L-ribulose 3-epimerase
LKGKRLIAVNHDAGVIGGGKIPHIPHLDRSRGLPGSGHAIPPGVFDVLRNAHYTGWLTIEAFGLSVPSLVSRLHLWRSFGNSDEEVATLGLKFIRDHLAMP